MKRFPEIDIIKGIAVIMMVIFHYFYVANLMNKSIYQTDSGVLKLMADYSHNIFIFMVGINLVIGYYKNKKKNKTDEEYIGKQFKRALQLLIFGLIITFVTKIIFPTNYVRFGIFHFLSLAILCSLLFVNNIEYTLFGMIIFLILNYAIIVNRNNFIGVCSENNYLCFILGIFNYYGSIDHFAFIPHFMTLLSGMAVGHVVYKDGVRNINLSILDNVYKNSSLVQGVGYLGKQSLNIYLFHWVIIYYMLYMK